jgi:acetyl esterase/lipase
VPPDPLEPDRTVRYADHADGVVDLHLPGGSSTGHEQPREPDRQRVVVLLHGGFWKTAYDRRHTRPLARALATDGFVVATPEYRRVGPGGTGGWPVTGQDVVDAVTVLPTLLAGVGVPAATTTVVGHSAGGHLALWLATAAPPDRVVALAPVCDLREAIRRGLGSDAARAFLGGVDPDRADPMLLLDDRPDTRITVLHGTRDDTVPVDLARRLVARHPWIEYVELDTGHYELIDPGDPACVVLRSVLDR